MDEQLPHRLVITGASGYVGKQLIPRLEQAGCTLLLVGRSPEALRSAYKQHNVSSYENWPEYAEGYDAVVHLAAINNNQTTNWNRMEKVNALLPAEIAQQAEAIGIPLFIQASSFHALDDAVTTAYAQSKRLAQAHLDKVDGIKISTMYFPLVWGDQWPRTLNILNGLPPRLASKLFRPLAAIKPSVQIDTLCSALHENLAHPKSEVVVADDIDKNGWYRAVSTAIDYGFALSTILLFWWAYLLIFILIRSSSPGPGIFTQPRVGKDRRIFTCYKFRTMLVETKQAGTHEVSSSSITSVGGFLRRTKLDEIPQAINILMGDVRLIGPRPSLPSQLELITARNNTGIYKLRPGISGWAQIHGVDMSEPNKLATWDARYVGMRSVLLDLRIILATALGRGRGDRVPPKRPAG